MLDQLIDKYIAYSKVAPSIVTGWLDTYGKDVLIYQNDRKIAKAYSNVFGTSYASYAPTSNEYEVIKTKILVDYEDWNKSVQSGAPANFQFVIKYVKQEVKVGDLLTFDMRGVALTYKITELTVFQDLFFKVDAQIVINKGDINEV